MYLRRYVSNVVAPSLPSTLMMRTAEEQRVDSRGRKGGGGGGGGEGERGKGEGEEEEVYLGRKMTDVLVPSCLTIHLKDIRRATVIMDAPTPKTHILSNTTINISSSVFFLFLFFFFFFFFFFNRFYCNFVWFDNFHTFVCCTNTFQMNKVDT